jgi:hypothetical protein
MLADQISYRAKRTDGVFNFSRRGKGKGGKVKTSLLIDDLFITLTFSLFPSFVV